MSNETFLISMTQNNDLSKVAVAELRQDLAEHPLNQRLYTQIASLPGNSRQYSVNKTETRIGPLLNKKILFLGSSVTFGFGALGESFVDYLWKHDGVEAIKDAENGTTLVDQDTYNSGDSYVARFKENLKEDKPDAFVLQLSTNDTKRGSKDLGKISDNGQFNTQTITGALEYMISTAQSVWQCPIFLYTNPYFEDALYYQMVERSHELAEKYHFEIIDLYNNPNFRNQGSLYMADPIHPTRAGYQQKWLPIFEQALTEKFQ